jgi:hypothetical protein
MSLLATYLAFSQVWFSFKIWTTTTVLILKLRLTMTLTLKLRLRKSVISLLLSGLIESIVLGRKTMVVGAICVPCRLYIWWIVLCFRSICRHESCISHGWSMMRSALETLFMAEKPRAKFRKGGWMFPIFHHHDKISVFWS